MLGIEYLLPHTVMKEISHIPNLPVSINNDGISPNDCVQNYGNLSFVI